MRASLFIILVLLCSNSHAGVTVAEYWGMDDVPKIKTYLMGVGTGYQFTNAYMQRIRKVQPLFCAPVDLKLNADNYKDMLDAELKHGYNTAAPIEAMLLQSLIRSFPCK